MKKYTYDAVVIGSGCGGFNAADCLFNGGMTNIALITEGIKMGTSRNTGSDKQTYYKQAVASDSRDGAGDMAETLFSGMAINGDIALTESANSLKCFFKLVNLGVPFPQNEYGEFVGYQTDHDENKRATSAGPLTSKYMTEALEKEVLKKGIKVHDNTEAFKLIVKNGRICGVLTYNTKEKDFIIFISDKVILATGGCAYLYKDKVFPYSQSGMSGMAIEAGAKTANLTEWQYGLASTDFRWNVSGTYQQVLPKYISVDENGVEEEFLLNYFDNPIEAINLVFQKGYQWPFDSRKINGSSQIDIIVHKEMQKGRTVYMDFRSNPTGLDFEKIADEARNYLKNSNALFGTPIERLEAMNKKAISLYKSHGIDLYKDKLKVAVCAQHQNGGLYIDSNYETSVKGLFAIGESAGVFGVYRPGGTALNSTQVSSMRAAECILKRKKRSIDEEYVLNECEKFIAQMKIGGTRNIKILKIQNEIQSRMSISAGFLRDENEIVKIKKYVKEFKNDYFEKIGEIPESKLYLALKLRDMIICAYETLSAMAEWCEKVTYRGGAITVGKEKNNNLYDNKIICTRKSRVFWEEPRAIPKSDTWFERVYNRKG